ncbi:MAG: GDSL-type esterase/lipase family protein [Bacteroidia bacterium]|nr:GDSL-type esterase/lipase family protein [Bacteroidia bacterium]
MSKLFFISFFLFVAVGLQAADTIRVACIGNSITYGAGILNRDTESYPAVLGQLLGSSYQVKNFGLSSRTLLNKGDRPYMNEKTFKVALNYLPNIVVIKLGTNDTKPLNWKFQSEFKQDLSAMVDSFQALSSKPTIFLCYPAKAYAVTWGINDSTIMHGVMPYVKSVAKEKKLKIIDLHKATLGMPELFPDKIHPNAAGAKILATTVYKAIRNVKK